MEEPQATAPGTKKYRRRLLAAGGGLIAFYVVLLLPDKAVPALVPTASRSAFAWNQEAAWKEIEARFDAARRTPPAELQATVRTESARLKEQIARAREGRHPVEDPLWTELELEVFALGARVAALPAELPAYADLIFAMRDAVKEQSVHWDVRSPEAKIRLYRLLYGGRAALEEAMLQAPSGIVPPRLKGRDEPSAAPSAMIRGVRIHSGDLLLSRGKAPTSALIARGSDFPGNFSHVALVHVDEATSAVSVVEAHIERGVAISTVEEYLGDPKRRVMVLRLRADAPALAQDPKAAHRAASAARGDALARHIPYDFEMDFRDHSRIFCSEVASAAYERVGITLWMGLSTLSTPGVCSWLSSLGVRNFLTQEPSDLEYDPQLCVVAEWRDPVGLWEDHLDNAVTETMLEEAERGRVMDHRGALLPVARMMKAYSWTLNAFGAVGPIPEGMSATVALRLQWYNSRFASIRATLVERARAFQAERGHTAPYWELVRLART